MNPKDYAMIALSASLLISLGFNAMPDANYYCDNKEIKAYCFELSSSGKTCYTLPSKQGGKLCSEGWIKFVPEIKSVIESSPLKYLCNQKECLPI